MRRDVARGVVATEGLCGRAPLRPSACGSMGQVVRRALVLRGAGWQGGGMLILVPVLLISVLVAMAVMRRGVTLTRDCRWRLDRAAVEGPVWRCAVCGAVTQGAQEPRHCLRAAR